MREELKRYDVECRNLNYVTKANVFHFAAKPFAILHSKFRQVLFLDADNVCTSDPTYLFDHEEFLKTGAVFWPDYWRTDKKNPIWKVIGCKYRDTFEQDSGQILIDKLKTWKELNLCCFFNLNWAFYYQFLLGDKDTFRFAWMALNRPFSMIHHEPGSCGYIKGKDRFLGVTIVQHDFNGNMLFLHRNSLKWDITRDSEFVWEEIRKFKKGSQSRTYYFENFGHLALEIYGDIEGKQVKKVFPDLEKECMTILMEFRSSPLYQRYLIDYYIMLFRRS
jgi:alpha 1,2-mannosyltransferase